MPSRARRTGSPYCPATNRQRAVTYWRTSVLGHRVVLNFQAEAEGVAADKVIAVEKRS